MVVAVFLTSLLGAMALGMPIAFALMFSGVALMMHLNIFDAQLIAQNTIDGADNFVLMAVPFFMLAGEFMNAGGLSKRIVNMAMALVGHIRGGLGYVAVFAAVAGSPPRLAAMPAPCPALAGALGGLGDWIPALLAFILSRRLTVFPPSLGMLYAVLIFQLCVYTLTLP